LGVALCITAHICSAKLPESARLLCQAIAPERFTFHSSRMRMRVHRITREQLATMDTRSD
jgi:maleate cis-trans isomerase